MIGTLNISGEIKAALHDDGRWECAHKGYESELNSLFRPRGRGVDSFMPFGVGALSDAAERYGCEAVLDESLASQPTRPEVAFDPGKGEGKEERKGGIPSPFRGRVKALLAHTKAYRKSPKGYCIDTDTGKRVSNEKCGGASSQNSAQSAASPADNESGKPPTPSTGGKPVSKPKKPKQSIPAPTASEIRAPRVAPSPLKREEPKPEEKGRKTNPRFESVDRAILYPEECLREGDNIAMYLLRDQQEEGTKIPGADFNAPNGRFSIQEQLDRDNNKGRGAARRILENLLDEYYDAAALRVPHGLSWRQRMESQGWLALDWNDQREYTVGRCLEALGWRVDWAGEGAPRTGDPRIELPDQEFPPDHFRRVHTPKGSVPICRSMVGQTVPHNLGAPHTGVRPDQKEWNRLKDVIKKARDAVYASRDRAVQGRAYVGSGALLREVQKLAPFVTPTELWSAIKYSIRRGLSDRLDGTIPDFVYGTRELSSHAPMLQLQSECMASNGHSPEDGVYWVDGFPQLLILGFD